VLRLVLAVFALGFVAPASPAQAAQPRLALPAQIPPAEQQRLAEIMRNPFAATRVEGEPHLTRPEVFEYLLDHPEFATHVTRALRVARYRVWHTADGLWLEDGWGVVGRFAVVHAEPGLRLMHAWGRFEQRFLPDIRGQALVAIEYGFRPGANGRAVVTPAATGYVQVDGGFFLDIIGRVGAPFIQSKADREARQLLRTFAKVSRAIEQDAPEVYRKVSARPDVPREALEEFRRLLGLP
jgi:hypothetical protein